MKAFGENYTGRKVAVGAAIFGMLAVGSCSSESTSAIPSQAPGTARQFEGPNTPSQASETTSDTPIMSPQGEAYNKAKACMFTGAKTAIELLLSDYAAHPGETTIKKTVNGSDNYIYTPNMSTLGVKQSIGDGKGGGTTTYELEVSTVNEVADDSFTMRGQVTVEGIDSSDPSQPIEDVEPQSTAYGMLDRFAVYNLDKDEGVLLGDVDTASEAEKACYIVEGRIAADGDGIVDSLKNQFSK